MINTADASNAIEFFESAVRSHENMGSQRPSDWAVIEEDLKNAKANMDVILNTLSIVDRLKEWCNVEWQKAQDKIEKEGYSFELSHRTDIMEEVLEQIKSLDANPQPAAPALFLD